jgi:glycosyltransferase involved in cell wall biosynthesis
MKKTIEIFFWNGYVAVAPTLINLANSFAEKGHNVFIYCRKIYFEAPMLQFHNNVNLIEIANNRIVRYCIEKIPNRTIIKGICEFYVSVMYFNRVISKIRKRIKSNNRIIIGIDAMGLLWANMNKKDNDILFYLSLELTINRSYCQKTKQYVKKQEIKIHKNQVSLTIIQDKYRLDSLKKNNRLDASVPYAILTNSPRTKTHNDKEKNNYFEEKFSLPVNSFKILSAGMISDETMSFEVAKSFSLFNRDNTFLIFHERQKRSNEEEYIKKVKNVGGNKLVLSLEPVSYESIYKIYASADIGLVFYNASYGENFSNIVGASGKLTHYLQYGMPVICFDLPGFRELIETYHCGVVIKDLSEMEDAVNFIEKNYQSMKDGARQCYLECYNFDNQFDKIYDKWVKNA